MKEFIEKLFYRLEKEHARVIDMRAGYEYYKPWKNCYLKIKEIVKELAEEHKGGWIPCSEKYPEDNQTVLTIDSEGNMEVLDYDTNWENSFCKYGGTVKVFNIIAWQPLPEPYKEMEDGD